MPRPYLSALKRTSQPGRGRNLGTPRQRHCSRMPKNKRLPSALSDHSAARYVGFPHHQQSPSPQCTPAGGPTSQPDPDTTYVKLVSHPTVKASVPPDCTPTSDLNHKSHAVIGTDQPPRKWGSRDLLHWFE